CVRPAPEKLAASGSLAASPASSKKGEKLAGWEREVAARAPRRRSPERARETLAVSPESGLTSTAPGRSRWIAALVLSPASAWSQRRSWDSPERFAPQERRGY